jgi:hypothetical protein
MKSPKAPKPTAEENAMVARQSRVLDEETADMEKRLKAVTRGTLGSKSLLAKASTSGGKSASQRGSANAGGRSLMGMGGMGRSAASGLIGTGNSGYQRAINTQLRNS